MTQPTNAALLQAINKQGQAFKDHAADDHRFQTSQGKVNTDNAIFMAETEGKLAKLDHVPTKEELGPILVEAMNEYFKNKGKTAYGGLLVAAGVITALVVIGGGAKTLLGWIGFKFVQIFPIK